MSLTLTRMRELVRKGLGGRDATELPNTDVDEYLNMALWNLDNRFPFKEKECLVTTNTVAGQRSYSIPNDLDAIRNVAVVDDETGKWKYLHEMTSEWLAENGADDDEDRRAIPDRWMRRDDSLVLDPIPDAIYEIRLEMWRTVASLLEGTVDTPELPRNWHEIVVEEAIVRGHFYNQDYNLAQQAANFPIGKSRGAVLETSKEEEGTRYAGVKPIFEWPEGHDE